MELRFSDRVTEHGIRLFTQDALCHAISEGLALSLCLTRARVLNRSTDILRKGHWVSDGDRLLLNEAKVASDLRDRGASADQAAVVRDGMGEARLVADNTAPTVARWATHGHTVFDAAWSYFGALVEASGHDAHTADAIAYGDREMKLMLMAGSWARTAANQPLPSFREMREGFDYAA